MKVTTLTATAGELLRTAAAAPSPLWPGTLAEGVRGVVTAAPADGVRALRQLALRTQETTVADPPAWLLTALRGLRPVYLRGRVAFVTRYADVQAVLRDPELYTVAPYAAPMAELAGPFVLSVDGFRHDDALAVLRAALPPGDVAAMRSWAADTAAELTAEGTVDGRLDVVALADRVATRVAADWLGVPGPDEATTLLSWSRTMFEGIFLNLAGQRSLAEEARRVSDRLAAHLDELLARADADAATAARSGAVAAAARSGTAAPSGTGAAPGTVLARLVEQRAASGRPEADVRSDLVGLLVGTVPTLSEAVARVVDELLRRPAALAGARQAALARDDDLLWRHVREAMRFAPPTTWLMRATSRRATLGSGTRYATEVPAGTLVMAATGSAMMDARALAHPREFRVDRPDHDYLHFGVGPHACLGRHVAAAVLPAAVTPLLLHRGIRRAPGPAGELRFAGRWPASLAVDVLAPRDV